MRKNNISFIANTAIVAGLYVALTWLLAPISFGAVQFRLSEVLVLLVVLNPKYALALILGCFIANTTSPLGWYDLVFGTLATSIAVILMTRVKNVWIAALFPVLSNGIIIALELGIAFDMLTLDAYLFNALTVGLGELGVLYLVGIPVIYVIKKNQKLAEFIGFED